MALFGGALWGMAAEGSVEHVQLNSSYRSLSIQTERWDDYVAGLLHLLSRLASWRQALSAWARALGLFLGERTAWAWDHGCQLVLPLNK